MTSLKLIFMADSFVQAEIFIQTWALPTPEWFFTPSNSSQHRAEAAAQRATGVGQKLPGTEGSCCWLHYKHDAVQEGDTHRWTWGYLSAAIWAQGHLFAGNDSLVQWF